MSAEQQCAHRVAELAVGHRVAVLVVGAQEHPEDVVLVEVTAVAPLGGLFEHDRVDRGHRGADAREGTVPALVAGSDDHRLHEEPPRVALAHQRQCCRAQALDAVGVGDAEDHGDDHLQRDRLHVGVGAGRPSVRPARKRVLGLALHDVLVVGKRPAAERRQLHLAPAHVLVTVDVRQPGRAEDERMRRVLCQRGAEAQHAGVGG